MPDACSETQRFQGRIDTLFHVITVSYLAICLLGAVLLITAGKLMPLIILAVDAIAVVASFAVFLRQVCRTLRNGIEIGPDAIKVSYGLRTVSVDAGQVTMVVAKRADVVKCSAPRRALAIVARAFVQGEASLFEASSSFDRIYITAGSQVVALSVDDEQGFLQAAARYFPNASVCG